MNRLLLTVIFLGSFCSSIAQNVSSDKKDAITTNEQRDFHIDKQLELYKVLPTTLSLWSQNNWSSIGFNGSYSEGAFKNIDDFQKSQKFRFKTESVQSFSKNGLTFYGKFTFNTSKDDEAVWNLFHSKSTIGSPFRTVTKRMGDWRTKHYGLYGTISKKIGNRIHLGAAINYTGDLYFRIRDTRNDQTNLTMDYTGSITYQISDFAYLSLGASYHRKRSEPMFNNDFIASESEYFVYTSNGLGEFDNQQGTDRLNIQDKNPQFTLSYHKSGKNRLWINYSIYPGKEEWRYYITALLSNQPEELYKYDYLKHNLTTSYLINTPNFRLLSKIKSLLISGKGYKYITGYQNTYNFDGINIDGSFDMLRENSKLFNQLNMDIELENISKKDMRYGHIMKYTNIATAIETGCNIAKNEKNRIQLLLNGRYKYNLSYTHDVVAAGAKPYTINIAHFEMAYATADYAVWGGKLSWFKQYKNIGTEWNINFQQTAPVKIRISNQYSLLEKTTRRNSIELNFNLFF